MSGEIAQAAADVVPYVTAALSAYGGAVLAKAEDSAADATVGIGRRLLQRIFGQRQEGEPLPAVLARAAADPGDADYLGAVRAAIRDVLESNAQLFAEVREILAGAKGTVTAGSQRTSADHGAIAQSIVAGGDVSASHTVNNFTAGRDITHAQGDIVIHRTGG